MVSDKDPGKIGDLISSYIYPNAYTFLGYKQVAALKGEDLTIGIIIKKHTNSNWIIFWPKFNLTIDLPPYMYKVISEGRKEDNNVKE